MYNKIKANIIIVGMIQSENITMLKAQPKPIQLHYNPAELKATIRQKELIISQQTKKISIKREQMKNLSKHVNSLIEKQMKKSTKERPSFHTNYSSNKLNSLRDEKDKIFAQIQRLKQEIKSLQVDQPQSIVKEMMLSQAKIEQLTVQINKVQENKAFITKALQQNKEMLDKFKEFSCLIDLEKKQTEMESIKKQCKHLEKEINKIEAEQLQRNSYYLQIKMRYEKQVIEQEIEMDQQEFKELIKEINQLTLQRNIFQKQAFLRIKNCQKSIFDLQKNIKDKHAQIRQIQNSTLRASLQFKRMNSMVQLRQEYSSKKTIFKKDPPKQQKKQKQKSANPEEKKLQKRIINKIYMIQKDDANCIYIGDWIADSKTFSDKQELSLNNVERLKSLIFYLSNGKVIGIKSIYIDKNNVTVQGKGLYNQNSEIEMTVQINLQEVVQLQYSTKSEDFYIRFLLNNGSWKELGQRGNQIEKINLQPYYVKYGQFQLNQSNSYVQSLKLLLQQKQSQQKLGLSYVAERTSSQMSYSNFESSPTKKKVVIKGRSLKKIKEQPIIDHRLMLNKHR